VKPLVSIVVCTRNRALSLGQALESLIVQHTQDLFTYEIVVINNNSSDNTSEIVKGFSESNSVVVREVIETIPGIVPARNRGVNESRGDWIAFFDDDQLAHSDWVLKLIGFADQQRVLCVGGAVTLKLPEDYSGEIAPICRMLLGETVGMHQAQPYTPRRTPGAGNMMVHKSVFARIGLFDMKYNQRGEDTDLFLRMHAASIPAWFTPEAIVEHVIPKERLSPEYLLRVSQVMSQGQAASERNAVGGYLYPLYWCARLGQAGCVILPQYAWSLLTNDRTNQLAYQCRLRISRGYLIEGLACLFANL
jgi:glycosyltransferase involved in cell wall biosynthesis